MKKIICFMMFFVGLSLSCDVVSSFYGTDFTYPAIEVNLFEENKVDFAKAKEAEYGNKLVKRDDSFIAYRANTDTSVFVYLNGKQLRFFKMCSSVEECDELYEKYDFAKIFSDEMKQIGTKKLFEQEFNVDSLTKHILAVMTTASSDGKTLAGISYNLKRSYVESDGLDSDFADEALTAGMFCHGFCDYLDTLRQCPELTTTFIPEIRFQNHAAVRKISNSVYLVENSGRNEMYRLYDLNGVIVNQGLVQNGIIHVRKTPAILEISYKRFLLK